MRVRTCLGCCVLLSSSPFCSGNPTLGIGDDCAIRCGAWLQSTSLATTLFWPESTQRLVGTSLSCCIGAAIIE